MTDLSKYANIVYKIIGAAMTVHSELGYGLLEPVYQEALHLELLDRGIANDREIELPIYYKEHLLEKKYRMDIVVDDVIVRTVVQLSAVDTQAFGSADQFWRGESSWGTLGIRSVHQRLFSCG